MNINDIIVKPIVTEKSAILLENNVYTFEVNPKATKTDIRRAIETIFAKSNVKVSKINIIKVKQKAKRLGRFEGYKKGYKKAIVTLSSGSIPIYGSKGIENTNKKKPLNIIDTKKIMNESEGK